MQLKAIAFINRSYMRPIYNPVLSSVLPSTIRSRPNASQHHRSQESITGIEDMPMSAATEHVRRRLILGLLEIFNTR
jgi:hypothetical protein